MGKCPAARGRDNEPHPPAADRGLTLLGMPTKAICRRALLRGLSGGTLLHAAGFGLAACGATAGKRVTFRMAASVSPGLGEPFHNAHGWTLTVERVALAIGEWQFFETAAYSPSVAAEKEHAWRELLLPTAHAHPGHFDEGGVQGEGFEEVPLVIASGQIALPDAHGVAGAIRSARVGFDGGSLDGWAASVSVRAERDGETRWFDARAGVADMVSHHGAPEVWGCPFDNGAPVEDDGEVMLQLQPDMWLVDVDPTELPRAGAAPSPLAPEMMARTAFIAGLRNPDSYRFEYRR